MKDNFQNCLDFLLRPDIEGGFVYLSSDPGGMTNLGVTKSSWEHFVGHEVGEPEMRALDKKVVTPFYVKEFWERLRGDELPKGIDLCVFDFAVNSGFMRSIRTLQSVAGCRTDGVIGPRTLASVQEMNAPDLINKYCDERIRFMQSLPTWKTFGKGWSRRVASVREASLKMVSQKQT